MPVTAESMSKAVKQMREVSPKRKFEQGVDISFTMTGIDPKKTEGRISEDVILPHGAGKQKKIMVFADGELAKLAKDAGADAVMRRSEIEALQGNKKQIKKLVGGYDFTVAQSDFMVLIGKVLGSVLGPRGKMPKPVPTNANPAPVIERLRRTVRLASKAQLASHGRIGREGMPDEQLVENARAVVEAMERKISDAGGRVKAVYLKTTMGKPVKVEVS
jgi:large subunit ribosomal protein L1